MISDVFRDPASLPADLRFLAGGGEATRLILDRDWSAHPLGPPARWPDILKTSLSTILNSPESMILAWGRDEMAFFFNESHFPLLGPRLSWAMGAPFNHVWADAWEQAKPIVADAFAGRSQRWTPIAVPPTRGSPFHIRASSIHGAKSPACSSSPTRRPNGCWPMQHSVRARSGCGW